MAAVVTDNLKKNILQALINDFVGGDNNYYIGLGRSEYWDSSDTAPNALNNMVEQRRFRNSIQGIKKVRGVSFVVPRRNWTSGAIYSAWDDTQVGYSSRSYYVMNSNNHVYICLRQGKDNNGSAVPSVVNPTGSNNDPFETADGYVWKFLYTVSEINAKYFLSAGYMPVSFVENEPDSDASGIILKQWEVQGAAKPYMLSQVVVDNSGSGYTTPPTAKIVGVGSESDGGEHLITTIDSSGEVTKVEIANEGSTLNYIYNLQGATIEFTGGGGSGASARPVISSSIGFGADAREDLKAGGIMFNSKIEGDDSDFITVQDFRQIGLIKNPKLVDSDGMFTDETGNALDHMLLSNISVAFSPDKTIEGSTSGARAYIDRVVNGAVSDTPPAKIYFHQNKNTGFKVFTAGEVITEIDGPGEGRLDSGDWRVDGEFDPWTGDIMYIDNRSAVERVSTQSEDVKVIIQL